MEAITDCSAPQSSRRETQAGCSGRSPGTSRLHRVEDLVEASERLHRGAKKAHKLTNLKHLSAGAGRGNRTPKGRSPADFEYAIQQLSRIQSNEAVTLFTLLERCGSVRDNLCFLRLHC